MDEQNIEIRSLFSPLTNKKKAILWIIAIGFVVYFNALFGQFVWDDMGQIVNSVSIDSIKSIPHLFVGSDFQVFYRPFFFAFITIVQSIFGLNVFYFHFFQIAIHIANSVFVFILFKKFFDYRLSFFLSLIFLVHPINTEAVAYISAMADPLSVFFGMAGTLMISSERTSKIKLFLSFLMILLSLLTKEAGLPFIFIPIIYIFLLKRDKRLIDFSLPIFVFFSYFLIRFGLNGIDLINPEIVPIARLTFVERIFHIPIILLHYLSILLFPINLAVNQIWTIGPLNFFNFYLPLFIIFVLIFFVINFFISLRKQNNRSYKEYIFFLVWFLISISIYLQLIPLDMTVADRWLYLPLISLLGLIGVIMKSFKFNAGRTKGISLILGITLILLLSLRTIVRNSNWYDGLTLFTHDSRIHTNFDTENNIGNIYVSMSSYDMALNHFEKSVALFPYETNLFNIGSVYEYYGNLDLAKKYYLEAFKKHHYLAIKQKHLSFTYVRLSYLFLIEGDYQNAKRYSQIGIEEYPENVNLWIILTVAEYKVGNIRAAISSAEKVRSLSSDPKAQSLYEKILNGQPVDIPKQ